MEPVYTYSALIVHWVDGDTVDLHVDCGFHIKVDARFRLYGVDTPERGRPGYYDAINHNEALAPAGSEVIIKTYKAADKYGRFLSDIYVNDVSVNQSLIEGGFAVAYFGGTKLAQSAILG